MIPATPASAAAPELKAPAAPVVPAAPSNPPAPAKAPEPGTTAKLFSDMAGSRVPGAPPAPEATPPAPGATPPAPPPAAAAPPAEVLDLTALSGKMVKLKVGDKEEVVPVEEALRRAQLDTHLTKKGQDLAAKEHELNEREKALRKTEPPPAPPKSPTEGSIISDDPVVQHLLKVTDELKRQNESLIAASAPVRHEQNMKVISDRVKTTLGFEDFSAFRPQLEQMFNAVPADQRAFADNEGWWVSQYQVLKLKDMQAKQAAPPAPPLPARPSGGAMPELAGGGALPPQPPNEADTVARAAFQKAQASGSTEDWTEYFRLDRLARAAA